MAAARTYLYLLMQYSQLNQQPHFNVLFSCLSCSKAQVFRNILYSNHIPLTLLRKQATSDLYFVRSCEEAESFSLAVQHIYPVYD